MKEKELQTEGVGGLTSFGQISDGAEHFIGVDGDTQHSTNLNLTTDMNQRPHGRVQSAHRGKADGSFANIMSHHGPSQPDLRQNVGIDYRNQVPRPTKSAANKYRQMIGHGDAIQEEIDYNDG